jgi:protein involved in polysaccharide export with SLBB domain
MLFGLLFFILSSPVTPQETGKQSGYLLGDEEELQMKVHVWGEVSKPGEYLVPYNTNILELISKAGGPTVYANLSKIRLTRQTNALRLGKDDLKKIVSESRAGRINEENLEKSLSTNFSSRMFRYNLSDYLKNKKGFNPPPVMQPGDIIYIPRNAWRTWREVVSVAHELAIITSVYVWYLRAQN